MTKALITRALGNVVIEVIKALQIIDHQLDLYAGIGDIDKGHLYQPHSMTKQILAGFLLKKT